ncbi:hypothetical protein HHO41_15125 [Bacillus sp. DNRA2]|uniref:hypothetical protein n=1 Tax=Bacillus sp. DNRA2 TaxID=2723053 RepID=UPI00145D47BF|nr:hypothetical protein [Bacillus sp. DNRA2]NMD71630.1 hypothetical protein [Bacillus sp. DNRA2]
MKVKYLAKGEFDIKEIKAELKPFGGKCAKFVDDKLEYMIDSESKDAAYQHMKEKGYIE